MIACATLFVKKQKTKKPLPTEAKPDDAFHHLKGTLDFFL